MRWISMAIQNIVKRNIPRPIIANIGAPQFGQSNQSSGVGTLDGTGIPESADNPQVEL